MALTNLASAGTSAWQNLQQLAHTITRTVGKQLRSLLGSLGPRPPTHALPDARPHPTGRVSPDESRPPHGAADTEASPGRSEEDLPAAYGRCRAVLVARDPWSLFAHWEVPPARRIEVLRWLDAEGEEARDVLRLHVISGAPATFHDVELPPGAARMHLAADPDRTYRAEIGIRTLRGRFVPLATSSTASTPAALPSSDTSVRWVTVTDGGPPREAAVAWSGGRVTPQGTATALGPAGAAEPGVRPGSSDAMPRGPRASDALPIR